jgi:hypothetical protein
MSIHTNEVRQSSSKCSLAGNHLSVTRMHLIQNLELLGHGIDRHDEQAGIPALAIGRVRV